MCFKKPVTFFLRGLDFSPCMCTFEIDYVSQGFHLFDLLRPAEYGGL